MMSQSLCPLLLMIFLTGGAVVSVRASDNTIRCGYDNFCQVTLKLTTTISEMKNKLDEQAAIIQELSSKHTKDLEELKVILTKSLASTDVSEKIDRLDAYVRDIHKQQVNDVEELMVNLTDANSTQLKKHSEGLLSPEDRLETQNVCTDVNEKLDKLAENMRDIHSKEVRDLEELKVNLNRSLLSMGAISTQLGKHSADLQRHDERLKTHDVSQSSLYTFVKDVHGPQDCSDVRARGNKVNGVYRVYPANNGKSMEMHVYCDFTTTGESWLVFQRRKGGSVSFDRTWNEYANGFGDLRGDFWLGNDKLSSITTNKRYKLRIELMDFVGEKRYATYTTFFVRPSTDKYRLAVGGYSGNAGDSFSYHTHMMFSTKDQDNDAYSGHCAQMYPGGWWFNVCHQSNLNGLYLGGSHAQSAKGIDWYHWKGHLYSYKTAEMKITAW